MSLTDDHRQLVLSAVEQYELPLLRYAARLGLDHEQARDSVQHAFLRLCEQPADQLPQGLSAWLYAVTRNRAIDLLRQRRREATFAVSDQAALDCETLTLEPHSREVDPQEQLGDHELAERLRAIVNDLPAAQREVVYLWSEGLSHPEIAAATTRTAGAVRVLLHRALERVREHATVRSWLRATDDSLPDRTHELATKTVTVIDEL